MALTRHAISACHAAESGSNYYDVVVILTFLESLGAAALGFAMSAITAKFVGPGASYFWLIICFL